MSLLAGAAALLLVWLLGSLMLSGLGLRRDDATDLPLELAVGTVFLGAVGSLLVVAGIALSPLYIYVPLVLAGAVAWRKSALPRVVPPGWPEDRLARALLAVAVVVLIAILGVALSDRLSWDGWAVWVLKARILFLEGGLPADAWTRPGPFDFAHPDYPLALPLLDWWLFVHAGRPMAALASFGGAVWFALLGWLIWSGASAAGSSARYAAAATLAVAAFWPIAYYAVGGTADVIMTVALLGAAVELERASRSDSDRPLVRALLYLLLAALTKNEGLAVGAIGGAVVGWILVRRGEKAPGLYLAAMAPTAAGLLWRAWSAAVGAEVEQLGTSLSLSDAADNAVLVARALGDLALHRQWPALFLVVAVGVWRWRTRPLRSQTPAWALLGAYSATLIGVYLLTEQDLVWLLDTTLDRLLSTMAPAAAYLTVVGMPSVGTTERGTDTWVAGEQPG